MIMNRPFTRVNGTACAISNKKSNKVQQKNASQAKAKKLGELKAKVTPKVSLSQQVDRLLEKMFVAGSNECLIPAPTHIYGHSLEQQDLTSIVQPVFFAPSAYEWEEEIKKEMDSYYVKNPPQLLKFSHETSNVENKNTCKEAIVDEIDEQKKENSTRTWFSFAFEIIGLFGFKFEFFN